MSDTVIVAIPEKDDYVWRISSEQIPHMTLLNLGSALPAEAVAKVAGYIEHAVNTSLHRFGMSVDRRGVLGPNEADVLFFQDRWSKRVEDFMGFMLADPDIKTAWTNSPQFEGWTPHLTLGYPTSPAHPDLRDYPGIHWVSFDKIALWTGDSSGPEFELTSNEDFAMSDSPFDKWLEHHGIKGMRWGIRRGRNVQARFGGARTVHEPHKDAKVVKELKGKPVSSLSNDELKRLNERLGLERNFKSLNPATIDRGTKEANRILSTIGTGVKLLNSPAGKAAITIGTAVITKKATAGAASGASDAFLSRLKEL